MCSDTDGVEQVVEAWNGCWGRHHSLQPQGSPELFQVTRRHGQTGATGPKLNNRKFICHSLVLWRVDYSLTELDKLDVSFGHGTCVPDDLIGQAIKILYTHGQSQVPYTLDPYLTACACKMQL